MAPNIKMARNNWFAWVALMGILAGACQIVVERPCWVLVHVGPMDAGRPISPLIYGVNLGHYNRALAPNGIPSPIILRRLGQTGISLLRYPGGLAADTYIWNAATNDPDELDTDEFLSLCRAVGAEPFITVNTTASPELAAAWVAHAKQRHQGQVRFWEIGDEEWGPWAKGHVPPEKYVKRFRAFAKAMKAVDPTIYLAAPITLQPAYASWNRPVLQGIRDLVDIVSLTFYPQEPGEESDHRLFASTATFRSQLAELKELIAATIPSHRLPGIKIAIAGFNSVTWRPGPQTMEFSNALWLVDVLGAMGQSGIQMAAYWTLLGEPSPRGGDYGILAKEPPHHPRHSYYIFPLFTHLFGRVAIPVRSSDPQVVVYVAQKGETLHLILLNLHPEKERSVMVVLRDAADLRLRIGRAWLLNEKTRFAQLPPISVTEGEFALRVPPYSVLAVILGPTQIDEPAAIAELRNGSGRTVSPPL